MHSLTLIFLAALLIKVDATSDDPQDQRLYGFVLIIVLLAGPILALVQMAGAPFALCLQGLFCKEKCQDKPNDKRASLEAYELTSKTGIEMGKTSLECGPPVAEKDQDGSTTPNSTCMP